MADKGRFETYYGKEDSGKVIFEERKDCLEEIQKSLDLIGEIKKSTEFDKSILLALDEMAYQIESLRYSEIPIAEVKQKLAKYSKVPLGDGKSIHLSAFLTSTGEQKVVKSEGEYMAQVQKMVQNTKSNLTNLLIFKEGDEHLSGFLEELHSLEDSTEYEEVKTRMNHLTMSGIIKHYNKVKLEFLKSWLAPYEERLGKPINSLSPEEMQDALSQVEGLKKQELEDIGIRINADKMDDFYVHNQQMHELMNGESSDFWGFPEYRDQFVELVKKIINRFSFKLESHFLIFESSDKKIAYLVGFPDDAYKNKKKLKSGGVGLTPHLKVFFADEEGQFKEFSKESMEKSSDYFRTLKTAVVPFLASLSMIVEVPLSQEFKDAFDMWL